MKRGTISELINQVSKAATKKKEDLDRIEELLTGAIASVEPRHDFKKGLGERLTNQEREMPVELEGSAKGAKVIMRQPRNSFDFPLLATGLISGVVLIMMGVQLLIYLRVRSQSLQN